MGHVQKMDFRIEEISYDMDVKSIRQPMLWFRTTPMPLQLSLQLPIWIFALNSKTDIPNEITLRR